MGNPALTYCMGGVTPCKWCKYFGEWVDSPVHGRFVQCRYLRQPFWAYERGCRYWEREPGTDDEELPAVPR
jgi:hypothetical protein